MAAVAASPFASPLASPTRLLPGFQKEQTDTNALFEDVLAAWSAQQPRSTSADRQLPLEEPTSYPFPSLPNDDRTAPDVPCLEVPQSIAFSDVPSLDFDTLFDQPDLTSLVSERSANVTFDDVEAFLDDNIDLAQCMLLSEESTRESAPGQGPNNAPFLPMSDHELLMQDILFEFNDGNVQKAPPSPEVKPLNPGNHSQIHSLSISQTPFPLEPSEDLTSPVLSLAPTPVTPTLSLDWTVSTPADEHYSNASSSRKRQKTKELQHNNRVQYRDKEGSVIGALITLGHDKALRQPYSEAERAQTKITRRRGACDACRTSKKRCNRPESEYECCNNCKSKVLSMPCFVAKIIDARLFRDRPSPKHPRSVLRRAVFESLDDICYQPQRRRPIVVNLTQDLGLQMLVILARYDPMPGEVTHRVWKKDGQTHCIEMPPYCIANMEDAQRHMLEYISNFRSAWLKNVLSRSNEITRRLFDQAQRFAAFNPTSIVSKALDLCAASRIIERDWRVCGGPQDLGIPLVSDDETNPFFNFVPITPMMDAQLDQIVIHSFLEPTRDALLASLQTKMASPAKSSSFFEVFLTVSVLLSHAEWLLAHSRQNARRIGAKTRYNYLPRAEAYFHACNTLIAYWHYMCRGTCPAEMKWMEDGARTWAGLDGEQAQFLEGLKTRINASESKSMMLRLREENRYESELYWCHQMFFPNWKAGAKTVEDEIMTD